MLILVAGQKGGSCKSTTARALAVEARKAELDTLLADFDPQQQSSFRWAQRRDKAGHKPSIEVSVFHRVDTLLRAAESRSLVIVDGGPHSSENTLQIAQSASLVVIPTGTSIDDLQPALELGQSLKSKGVKNLIFLITRAPASDREIASAKENIEAFGFAVVPHVIRGSTAYSTAQDAGLAITETRYESLNKPALDALQTVYDNMNA